MPLGRPVPAEGARSIMLASARLPATHLAVVDVNQLESRRAERARRHDDDCNECNAPPRRKRDAAYMARAAKASRAKKKAKVDELNARVAGLDFTQARPDE